MGRKQEGPGLLEQDGARNVSHTKEHDEMITQAKKTVKRANWLKEFHVRSGLTSAEIVELIRHLCPGFDRSLLTKCADPERYGVQLSRRVINQLKRLEGGTPDE